MKIMNTTTLVFCLLACPLAAWTATTQLSHDHEQQAAKKNTAGHQRDHDGDKQEHEHGSDSSNHHEHGNDADAHDRRDHGHEEHENHELSLTDDKTRMADISVTTVTQQTLQQEILLPGEVKTNRYATSIVSPRINAQVSNRLVRLGQLVKKGQPLITLSSVEMAQAQGELIIANREWQRVEKLGRQVVSEKRYLKAQIARQQSRAKVIAYGMKPEQVAKLLSKGDLAGATGQFALLAPQNGTVIKDDFVVGEIVEPGRVLYEITDESTFWVEARARTEDATHIKNQSPARIRFQNSWFDGKVLQVQHIVDEETRTLPVTLEVTDSGHMLHPGQFVDVRLQLTSRVPVMAIPKAAALRNSAGEWVVFVESKPGSYKSLDITPIRTSGKQLVVEGLAPGMRIVTQGAFFLQSEMAKSGFAIHNH
ncbi:MAG: efflux RND transporter periplasmic adaptor subunit [Gammaproteobacteria bacterium]|jgi:RND family efflux transporter MFP subunit